MSEQFYDLAAQARGLLECDIVALAPGCADRDMRHPLLDYRHVGAMRIANTAGSGDIAALLEREDTRATCDIAVHTGQQRDLSPANCAWRSVTVMPLERPSGVLGLLICADSREQAFREGEHRLLRDFTPFAARRIERYLSGGAAGPGDEPPFIIDARSHYEFISMVSHELRRPLTAIKGYAALLQAYGGSSAARNMDDTEAMSPSLERDYLDHILEQTGHLEVLVSDLLDITRIQAGHLMLRLMPVNAALLCRRTAQVMRDQAERQHPGRYTFRCDLSPDLPLINADPDRLRQALSNLIDNAIKYSPDGGTIEVSASLQTGSLAGPLVRIAVRDPGLGISPSQQEQVFQPFSRLRDEARQGIAGAGIGLHLSRVLVEAMHGTIALTSRPGDGTLVSMTFPTASLHS